MKDQTKKADRGIRDRFEDMIRGSIGMKKWKRIKYLLVVLPFLIYIVAFHYVPLMGWIYAFCDYRTGQRWYQFNWVGLKHFQHLFASKDVIRVFRNTLVMGLLGI